MTSGASIGSMFAGIGGLELGLEMRGLGPVIWQAEIDPAAMRVLATHWPDVKRYDDVRRIDATIERPDIICGGFPCQGVSVAGKGAGLDDPRSGLWSEVARVVGIARPSVVFIENVSALVKRGLGRVLADLAALGFDATWDLFRASDVGAPHKRERLFLLAYSDGERIRQLAEWDQRHRRGERTPEREHPEPSYNGPSLADSARVRSQETGARSVGTGEGSDYDQRGDRAVDLADSDGRGREGVRLPEPYGQQGARGSLADGRGHGRYVHRFPPGPSGIAQWDGPAPAVRRSDARIPVGMDRGWRAANGPADRLRLLGNAVVPQVAALAWSTLVARAAGLELA